MSALNITLIDDTHPILRQNENGPCFIIALINAILLSDSQSIYSTNDLSFRTELIELATSKPKKTIPLDTLYSFLIEKYLLHKNDSIDKTNNDTEIKNISTDQLLNILPLLDSGLLINLSFDNIKVLDFHNHSSIILDLLNKFNLNLYHAFIMPNDLLNLLNNSNIKPNFDDCQDFLVSHADNKENDSLALKLETFLNSNKTEITLNGIDLLLNSLNENEIFLFFRNDHFNTCIKHENKIYTLVTDIGYINQPDIVWLPLSINDEGNFKNSKFQNSKIISNSNSNDNHNEDNTNQTDLLLAKQLQLEEDENISRNLQNKLNNESNVKSNKNEKNNDKSNNQISNQNKISKTNNKNTPPTTNKNKNVTSTSKSTKSTTTTQPKKKSNSNSSDCCIIA